VSDYVRQASKIRTSHGEDWWIERQGVCRSRNIHVLVSMGLYLPPHTRRI